MTIEILGLGESLSEYVPNGNITIGVNDIHSRIKTDYVVCVDVHEAFNRERLEVIKETKCKGFYSQLDCWQLLPNFNKISLSRICELNDVDKFRCSNNSPFVACVLAYKLGAKKIVLWGVDFRTHQHLKDASFLRALDHYKWLKSELKKNGCDLVIGSTYSALHSLL